MNANEFISKLYKQLGNDGSTYWNWCTENLWPNQGWYVDGYSTPYCAEFVSANLAWEGIDCIWFPDPCTFDGRDIPESQRIYGTDLRQGDVLTFDWDGDVKGDHTGFVVSVHDWGCHTIEGNTGGDSLVHERDRYWSDILFGIRPSYSDGSSVPPCNALGGKLDVDGFAGYYTVLDLQHALGTVEDGVISGQYWANNQWYPNVISVTYEGNGQSQLVQSLQARVGAGVDGILGYETCGKLQEYLVRKGYDVGPCGCDHILGGDSIRALQHGLNDGGLF